MEFKEGLKLIKETCKESLCINCPFDNIDGCILGDRHPEMWNVEEIGDRFIDVEDKMALEIDSVTLNTPCDMVNHPAHYTQGGIECIDAIKAAVTGLEGMEAVCTGNVIRYIWRWKFKNGLEDLKKCRWYIDKLIEEVEGRLQK